MSTSGDVVPWVGAASWESRVGVAVVETRNVMVAVVQLPWTSCHVCWHMHYIPLTARSSSRENLFQRYHFSNKILEISLVFTHGITPARVNHNRCFVKKCILMFPAMHGHLASYIRRTNGHLAAGCATDPNFNFLFRRLGAPDVVPHYKMLEKNISYNVLKIYYYLETSQTRP